MGYSTDYVGSVKIVPELTITSLFKIEEALRVEEHDVKWNLELTKDRISLEWKGCEKTHEFEESLNVVVRIMRESVPDFDLEGEFKYQGEEMDDRGYVRKMDGKFVRVPIVGLQEKECKCPECGHIFVTE